MPDSKPTPTISIVLPVYNGERFLNESIQSIIHQTFTDWELIIIDDCSTDLTSQLISRWTRTDSRITSFRNETNLKLPGSLNKGFSRARGKYYTWTSDDNRYRHDALRVLFDKISERNSADLIYAEHALINDQGHVWRERIPVFSTEQLLLKNGFGACFLYRAEVHTALCGYDETKFLVEDYDFWLRAMAAGFHFRPIHEVHYEYRLHPDSLTSQQSLKIERDTLRLQSALAIQCKQLPQKVRATAYLSYATAYIKLGDHKSSRRSLLIAISLSPKIIFNLCFWRILVKSIMPRNTARLATSHPSSNIQSK